MGAGCSKCWSKYAFSYILHEKCKRGEKSKKNETKKCFFDLSPNAGGSFYFQKNNVFNCKNAFSITTSNDIIAGNVMIVGLILPHLSRFLLLFLRFYVKNAGRNIQQTGTLLYYFISVFSLFQLSF